MSTWFFTKSKKWPYFFINIMFNWLGQEFYVEDEQVWRDWDLLRDASREMPLEEWKKSFLDPLTNRNWRCNVQDMIRFFVFVVGNCSLCQIWVFLWQWFKSPKQIMQISREVCRVGDSFFLLSEIRRNVWKYIKDNFKNCILALNFYTINIEYCQISTNLSCCINNLTSNYWRYF